jgi:hypothetical protein
MLSLSEVCGFPKVVQLVSKEPFRALGHGLPCGQWHGERDEYSYRVWLFQPRGLIVLSEPQRIQGR